MSIPMTACEWRLGEPGLDELRIVERARPEGPPRFAVTWRGRVANRQREWELEPTPSSRDDDFLARTRWELWEDAAVIAQRMYEKTVCSRCHGEGRISVNPGYPDPQTETDAVCPDCHGEGIAD